MNGIDVAIDIRLKQCSGLLPLELKLGISSGDVNLTIQEIYHPESGLPIQLFDFIMIKPCKKAMLAKVLQACNLLWLKPKFINFIYKFKVFKFKLVKL